MIFSLNDVERFAVFALTFEGGCTASANRAEEGSRPPPKQLKQRFPIDQLVVKARMIGWQVRKHSISICG
jgi:hypothetical protein